MSSPSLPSDDSMLLLTGASLPSTGVSTRPRRLSASSQHRRRASDVQRFSSAKTPALIATLNYGRAAVSPSASVPTRSTTTEAQSPTSPSFKNPDLYGGSGGISGRRKGVIFRCETCNKVYRHPSCLIKHRWEHSPHWANSGKVPLSKHQQVQLLEGATILAHLSGSAALPEDRAVWPSWTSGGSLPLPTGTRDPLARDQPGEDDSDDDGEIQEEDDFNESAIIDEDDEEDEGELPISASVQDGAGLRRSLRPRSRSTGSMLNGVGRTVRSGGVAKAIPRKSGPVKAGFTTPSNGRVTQVAPGVFVAPSPEAPGSPAHPGLSFSEARTGASAPISISIPRLGTSSIAASLEPTSPTAPSQSIGTSYGISSLAVLASLSLGAEPSNILSPPPTSSDLSFSSSSGRRGFSSSLPQSSVRSSSSGDSDELLEIDEDEDDVDMDGEEEEAAQRKRAEEEWEGMDLEMDDL